MPRVVVIGGGAAGMMAAGTAVRNGHRVTVVEHKPKTLLKLGITGKGRCNLTNDSGTAELVANTPRGGKFLYGAFTRFTPRDVMATFESLGVPLKVERGRRVFPVSDRAFDIVDALRRYAAGAEVVFADAAGIKTRDGAVCGVETSSGIIPADHVILATGGKSYPSTGSDGSGYRIARALGHNISEPEPSLVPLNAERKIVNPLAGLSLKNVMFMLENQKRRCFQEQGELLFTHTGVSGPIVLSASAHMNHNGIYTASLDFKPALSPDELDARLLREAAAAPNINFSSLIPKLLPKSLTRAMCDASDVSPGTKLNTLTREKRRRVGASLKSFPLGEVTKRGFDEAVVTSGGVLTDEIDPKTMRSKIVAGLSFAGEIIDADAYTGGFNLQIAWSTAYTAACAIK